LPKGLFTRLLIASFLLQALGWPTLLPS
jgi:hypothetical protein